MKRILLAAFVATLGVGGYAFAQTHPSPPGQESADETHEVGDVEEDDDAVLTAQASVSLSQAQSTALAARPGEVSRRPWAARSLMMAARMARSCCSVRPFRSAGVMMKDIAVSPCLGPRPSRPSWADRGSAYRRCRTFGRNGVEQPKRTRGPQRGAWGEAFSTDVSACGRLATLVREHGGEHPSRWAAVVSVASKIGCSAHTLNEWVKKVEVDAGKRAGVPTDLAEKLKALERENRELRQANEPKVGA